MTKTLTFHSYKGGTGKTHLSANLAVLLCKNYNKRVVIFDCDFRAPSLHLMFGLKFDEEKNWFLNDYLNGNCELKVTMRDVSANFNLKEGSLYVVPANFRGEDINKEIGHELDEDYQMDALQHMLGAREILSEEKIDLLLIDTGPGFVLPSINAIIASDKTFLVTKVDEFDMRGTRELIAAVYDRLMEKSEILVNKIPFAQEDNSQMIEWIEKELGMLVLWFIPCFCDVPREMSRNIFVYEHPGHEFSVSLKNLTEKLLENL